MEPFKLHTGMVLPMDRPNIDTDSIIPARFLKRIEKTGFGPFLFCDWRFEPDGTPIPDFILNDGAYTGSSILVAGRNFGSGSSREHAVWALKDYGFQAVMSASFADIFHKNCFENGLVPLILPEELVNTIMANAQQRPGYRLTVDLDACEISDDAGIQAQFVLHPDPETHDFRRNTMLNGLDEIAMTLRHQDKIDDFENARAGSGVPV
jgi:3-isopropylmalate/(R)-2-methylmalate dehydratase small subunit